MEESIGAIVTEIDALLAVNSAGDLSRLQALADQYFTSPDATDHLGVWFRLYERFPEDDGCGVFWSILHGIEAHPERDGLVVESVRRQPSRFPVMMINRLLNAGVRQVGGVVLLDLLRQVATDARSLPSVRESADRYVEHQRSRAEQGAAPNRGHP